MKDRQNNSSYEGGKVLYRTPEPPRLRGETDLARASIDLSGTRVPLGPGPFKHGSWMEWGIEFGVQHKAYSPDTKVLPEQR